MASLRDIRKRLKTVRNSQKMTKAMKLVAAAKLRRAQEKVLLARPFGQDLLQLRNQTLWAAQQRRCPPHPLQSLGQEGPIQRAALFVLGSDRGLCGPFNAALLRGVEQWLKGQQHQGQQVWVGCVGRKGRDYLLRRKWPVEWFRSLGPSPQALAQQIARQGQEMLAQGQVQTVWLAFNRFKSAISQEPCLVQVLPMKWQQQVAQGLGASASVGPPLEKNPYAGVSDVALYEPDIPLLLADLLPACLTHQVLEMLLESEAAEHGARMTAMDAATKNAKELSETLSLQYNRARQASITRELMDIVGGAEALAAM